MPITIYDGGIGSGKTVSLIRDLYPLRKTQILTNIGLNKKVFKTYKMITLEDIKNYRNWEYNNMTVVLDELHTLLDSRKSFTDINIILSYWFLQSRKRNVNILGTTQFIHQIEKRVRNNIDYLINCSCYKKYNKNSQYVDEKGIPTNFYVYQNLYNHSKNKYTRKDLFFANEYFYLYDTYEIVDFSNTKQNPIMQKIQQYINKIPEQYYPKLLKDIQFFKRNYIRGVLR